MSKTNVKQFVLERNQEQGIEFCSPSAQNDRRLYRAQHPTEFMVFKCMDGRLNLALYSEIPPGILQPFRNIGGRFDPGWPFFQEILRDGVNFPLNAGREVMCVTSYHFSKGDRHRCCAGFNYDTEEAKRAAFTLRDKLLWVFGDSSVYTITIGIETDEEALIFHGSNGNLLDLSTFSVTANEGEMKQALHSLYPKLKSTMLKDLIPLAMGNLQHIDKIRAAKRAPIDLEHREQIIAVGRGFDWLHLPNKALIIGPYSQAWPDIVKQAGGIILGNLQAGRIPKEDGVLLLVSALFRSEEGFSGERLKQEKVRYMRDVSEEALRTGVPELSEYLNVLSGVTYADTREFRVLE